MHVYTWIFSKNKSDDLWEKSLLLFESNDRDGVILKLGNVFVEELLTFYRDKSFENLSERD